MKKQRTFWQQLLQFFITTIFGGVAVVLPITLFVLLVSFIFNFTTGLLAPLKSLFGFPENVNDTLIAFFSLAIIIAAFFLIGLIAQTRLGARTLRYIEERVLLPLPMYSILRDTVQQFFGNKRMPFSEVVSVDVYGNDTRMIGFITDELPDDRYAVFVPTGPNPTNGFIFVLTSAQIERLDAKPEAAMRSIIGVGTGTSVLYQKK